jgi:2-polyprenyl-3-methyl-5-hydroxy-6-metoxy-1,4-benzoquinol methylase
MDARSTARGDIAKVRVACNNCGALDAEPIAHGRDHEYANTTSDEFTFVRCRCGLIRLDPRPAVSELGTIYPDDYYAYALMKRRSAARGADSLLARYMTSRLLRRLRPYALRVRDAAGARPARVLDIGCGDGSMLDQWRSALGGDAETQGVEMNHRAAELARSRGHTITASRIETAETPRGYFDLVYSLHVIEHVEDPTAFMTAARTTLRPEGCLLIDTPNVDTFDFRLFGARHWGGYHVPRHWTLYDASTFTTLARKTGFEVLGIEYCPSAIFWVWTLHSIASERVPRWADKLFPPVDIFLRASPWNVALLGTFTAIDLAAIAVTRRCSTMRVLLRPAGRRR